MRNSIKTIVEFNSDLGLFLFSLLHFPIFLGLNCQMRIQHSIEQYLSVQGQCYVACTKQRLSVTKALISHYLSVALFSSVSSST